MALTTGSQGSSATPATDFMGTASTAGTIWKILIDAGWTRVGQKTAATMGTTGPVDVWVTAATTVSSNVYTGTVLYIEIDDTNSRLRFRCSEVFDNAATGSPATNVKWGASGSASGNTATPTASFHNNDSFLALFQAQPTTTSGAAAIGWVNVAVSGGGFNYWMGADTNRVFVATQVSGNYWVVAGKVDYIGSIAGINGAVFIAGRGNVANCSFVSGAIGNGIYGNYRPSRELTLSSATGNFAFTCGMSMPHAHPINNGSGGVSGRETSPAGAIGETSRYHDILVASPCFVHGVLYQASSYPSLGTFSFHVFAQGRSHFARMSDFVVFDVQSSGVEPSIGDTLTISGATYVVLGFSDNLENLAGTWTAIAVRQAAF